MRLLNVNLENFRNVESASLAFESDRVFFIGPNGQVKTNLLEAIGMSSNLRSFRKYGTDGLVRDESEQCRMFFRFSDGKGQDREILLSFRPKGEKSLLVDGEKLSKLGDFLGQFPSVALSSRDFRLVREGPSERRKWLDLLLSLLQLNTFNPFSFIIGLARAQCLAQKGGGDRELDAFEQALIPSGLRIQQMRTDALPKLAAFLSQNYAALSSRKEQADLSYKPDLLLQSEQEWAKRLVEERTKDRIMGNTRRGPHRDDFAFLSNGKDARTFASEGQQRGLVLALRFAEFFFVRQVRDQTPLILADDVLGELDDERKANFNKLLPSEAQVFATGTAFPSPGESDKWETFQVSSGTFSKS